MGHARALISLGNIKIQEKYLNIILNKNLNVRQTEELVRSTSSEPTRSKNKTQTAIPEKFKEATAQLSVKLGAKVKLKRNNIGVGSIVISFKNDEDLDKIISLINE
jgi:ParB family chromosome partitioning protein